MAAPSNQAEPFPSYIPESETWNDKPEGGPARPQSRHPSITSRLSKAASTATRSRTSSLKQSFLQSNPPLGMWQATGEVGSKIPTLPEIRNGSFADEGWTHEGQMERRGTNPHEIHARRVARTSSASTRTGKSSMSAKVHPAIAEERHEFFPKRASISVQSRLVEETTIKEPLRSGPEEIQRIAENKKHTDTARSHEKDTSMAAAQADDEPQAEHPSGGPDETGTYPNGYRFPKKHTWTQSTMIGLRAFWKFFLTPFGFVVTIYGLNVVAWGAMIFFVLLNAAPAMCHPSCNAENSARKIWIEIDSQVLNGLFCVTGFGLLPWRARDFYYLMRWRIGGDHNAHRRLAGFYRGWYRLPGSDQLDEDVGPPPVYNKKKTPPPESPPPYSPEEIATLEGNPAIPLPVTSMPEPPLTGFRAPPSRHWALDFVVYMYMLNSGFQVLLCVWMWHWNRFDRPSWGTGVWITFGCLVGIFAGVLVFVEGSKVKKIEGIPVQEYDVLESVDDYQQRKAKEDQKEAKKLASQGKHSHLRHGGSHRVVRSEKLKGHQWFTRH